MGKGPEVKLTQTKGSLRLECLLRKEHLAAIQESSDYEFEAIMKTCMTIQKLTTEALWQFVFRNLEGSVPDKIKDELSATFKKSLIKVINQDEEITQSYDH